MKMDCLWFLNNTHLSEFILFSFQIFNVNQVVWFFSSRNWLCKNAFIIYNILGVLTNFSPLLLGFFIWIHVVIFSGGISLHFNLAETTALGIILLVVVLAVIWIIVVIIVTLVGLRLVDVHSAVEIVSLSLRVLLVVDLIILRQERLVISLIHICYQIMYYKIK